MKNRVLLIDDDAAVREELIAILTSHNYIVDQAVNGKEGLELAENNIYNYIITDISMPVMDGLKLLENLRKKDINVPAVVISSHSEMDIVRQAFKMGASDFIEKPFSSADVVLQTLEKLEEKDNSFREKRGVPRTTENNYSFEHIVSRSSKMTDIFNTIRKIADYKTTVLVTGESGTGKELIAKAIHFNSIRKKMPIIDINCGGIPDTLLESELFGHVKGAFTDAYRPKKGLFEEADGGTLFLDEMGELPLALQVKLLRALQEDEIRPLGDSKIIKVDVRIIAATAKNLRLEVNKGNFREDLFYRINVLCLEVPPLRQRREDIPLLVSHFIDKFNNRLGLKIQETAPDCLQCLMNYDWPGNVRELENVIERAMALSEEKDILVADMLPPELYKGKDIAEDNFSYFDNLSIKKNSRKLEKYLISRALAETKGNKTRAAVILEISLPALLYKIKEYKINLE